MEQNSRTAARRLGATASHRETVEQAEAYLRAHLDAPMRVSSLSRMVGLSERGLRDAFYSVRGVSPKRWLLAERLDRARRALRAGDSRTVSVTGVATNFGFYELGRFAATYRAAFGEVPSVTLRDTIRRSAESQNRLKGINDVCAR
jgi:transcriptional regulator GlxA family with amidase domain